MAWRSHGRQARRTGIVLTEEQKRRRRARSIAIALALGVLVVAVLRRDAGQGTGRADPAAVTHDDERRQPADAAPPPRHRRRRRLRRCASPAWSGAAYRGGAVLQLVLPRHRLRRHARRSRPSAPQRRARPQGHGALRRQRRPAACRGASSPSRTRSRSSSARSSPSTTASSTRRRARPSAPGGLQRHAADGRRLLPQDQLLLLHRAAPQGRARRATWRWSSSSIRRWPRIPTATTSTPSRCPTRSIRVREPSRPVADRAATGAN